MLLFKRIEIWNRGRGSWLNLSDYQFGIDRCPVGYVLGFFGITFVGKASTWKLIGDLHV